jgi:hypothetical protein
LGKQVSLLVGELVGGEFAPWPTHTDFGGNSNPEESSGFQGTVLQEVLGKIPVKEGENRNSCSCGSTVTFLEPHQKSCLYGVYVGTDVGI